jgi:hypothetical protein
MSTFTIYHGKATPIKAVGKNQCKLLSFAFEYKGWHTFKQDKATKAAVSALQSRGCLEVVGDQFRFQFPQ